MKEIDKRKFCYFPFMQLLLQADGEVFPCLDRTDYSLGKIPQKPLKEIWNDEPIRKLRREFLNGTPSKICQQSMDENRCHCQSRRADLSWVEYSEIQSAGPHRYDISLNGLCNLECIMCVSWKRPNGLYDKTDFWLRGRTEIFPKLLEIDVKGGEPFIQQDTFRLIKEITAVNKSCTWAFVTNGHYRFSEKIREALDLIQIRWLGLSIDSLDPEIYAAIRLNGDLSKPLQTLEDLIEYRNSRGLSFNLLVFMCVQKKNWKEVGDFLKYFHQREIEVNLMFAYIPNETSLLDLPLAEREEIVSYFEELAQEYGSELDKILEPLKRSLGSRDENSFLEKQSVSKFTSKKKNKNSPFEVLDWNGYEAAFSMNFRAGDPNHLDLVFPELTRRGLRGTFDLIANKIDRVEDWKKIIESGHRIGNLSLDHIHAGELTPENERDQVKKAKNILEAIIERPVLTFSYPFTEITSGLKKSVAAENFIAQGGWAKNYYLLPTMTPDWLNIPAQISRTDLSYETYQSWIDQNLEKKSWTSMMFHGVGVNSWGWEPIPAEIFILLLEYLVSKEKVLWVAPLEEVGSYWKAQKIFEAGNITVNGSKTIITWEKPDVFPVGVMLKIKIEDKGFRMYQGGKHIKPTDEGIYPVFFDSEEIVLEHVLERVESIH